MAVKANTPGARWGRRRNVQQINAIPLMKEKDSFHFERGSADKRERFLWILPLSSLRSRFRPARPASSQLSHCPRLPRQQPQRERLTPSTLNEPGNAASVGHACVDWSSEWMQGKSRRRWERRPQRFSGRRESEARHALRLDLRELGDQTNVGIIRRLTPLLNIGWR